MKSKLIFYITDIISHSPRHLYYPIVLLRLQPHQLLLHWYLLQKYINDCADVRMCVLFNVWVTGGSGVFCILQNRFCVTQLWHSRHISFAKNFPICSPEENISIGWMGKCSCFRLLILLLFGLIFQVQLKLV